MQLPQNTQQLKARNSLSMKSQQGQSALIKENMKHNEPQLSACAWFHNVTCPVGWECGVGNAHCGTTQRGDGIISAHEI